MHFRTWLSRTIFESTLVVMSILLALAVKQWQDDNGKRLLISRSLVSFEREIATNKDRIDTLYPFHQGLQKLLSDLRDEAFSEDSAAEIRNVLENSLQPTVLLTTAWDTAIATGALAQMDYELVYAMSLTYSIQERFRAQYNSGLSDLLASTVSADSSPMLVYAALRFLNDLVAAEAELQAVYQQALERLRTRSTPPIQDGSPAAREASAR